jgi:hypothetical protein
MELRPTRFNESYLEVSEASELAAIQFAAHDRANAISRFDIRNGARRRDLVALAHRMGAARRRAELTGDLPTIVEAPDAELAIEALRWDVKNNRRLSNEGIDKAIREAFASLPLPSEAA